MMTMPTRKLQIPRRQRGAALVIGLVLLLVLTVLAVSGMNSASTELVMAGNAQYRQDAFEASEIGIAQILALGNQFNPDPAVGTLNAAGNVPGSADTYAATVTPRGFTEGYYFFSNKDYATYYFDIRSQGNSTRSAQSGSAQGVAIVAKADNTWDCSPNPPPCALTP